MKENNKKKVAFFTLGCKLNFSETSTIARDFIKTGYERVKFNEKADVYVVNTCSVTEFADKKCRQTIKKVNAINPEAKIAVVGCYSQLKPEEIAALQGVDIVLGAKDKMHLIDYIENVTKTDESEIHSCNINEIKEFSPAYSLGDRTRSFLKIQDGCDYFCAYCTIPLARGKSRNASIEELMLQAKEIAKNGIKEIILTGVNIGDFGKSTNETFLDLLKELDHVEGIERIRISSIEPNLLTNEIIEFVAVSKKFLPHFHIPLQSGTDKILKLMRRKYDTALFAKRIDKIKKEIPNAFIGIDVIVGFPGETDIDFEQTHDFLKNTESSFLHVFTYSERPNTKTVKMEGKVSEKAKKERSKKLHELSERKLLNFCKINLGEEHEVLFERSIKDNKIHGFTKNYIKVETNYSEELVNTIKKVKLCEIIENGNVSIEII